MPMPDAAAADAGFRSHWDATELVQAARIT